MTKGAFGWCPLRRKAEACLGCEDFMHHEWHSRDRSGIVDRRLVCEFIKMDVGPDYRRTATREDVDALPFELETFESRLVPDGCEREPYPTMRRLREL